MNYNKVMLAGRLTRDPSEIRYIPSGQAVCDISLAVNDGYGDNQTVGYYDITVWGKTAENVVAHLSKGSPVFIEGKLRLEQWEKDGQKRSKVSVTALSVQFLPDGKGKQGDNSFPTKPVDLPDHDGEEIEIPF